ncbi:MAG: iron-containing alcohol dehydrogenase [Anaerolineae bacterium]|jgi:NADP-dependent alcohol dehydrogenase|nr:iron-containing alcohol dehydrogenase [Anaerolineae bacterium]
MDNFNYYNPTRIVFGKGTIAQLKGLVPHGKKILLAYGGGSIKRNGVYDQVMDALKGFELFEFGGIEANPLYETLMKAVKLVKEEGIDFLLSVGGGSVLDGTKFIAAAVCLPDDVDPWGILTGEVVIKKAIPLASVLTLPATGSESNGNSVISRKETDEKLSFASEEVFPLFSILDPETTYSLPQNQVRNGIVDTYVHVMEQYCTFPNEAPLQDRQAESILISVIETAQATLQTPPNYQARAAYMWNANQALNTLIGKGVPQDWATHGIGHELTAFYGVAHAESLALVQPSLLRHEKELKRAKLLQYAERVWGLDTSDEDAAIEKAISKTEEFYHSLGMPTQLKDYGIDAEEAAERIKDRFIKRGFARGEKNQIDAEATAEILLMAA